MTQYHNFVAYGEMAEFPINRCHQRVVSACRDTRLGNVHQGVTNQ